MNGTGTASDKDSRAVAKAYPLKLYPNRGQREQLARCAGASRWLWNHFLALQKQTYEADRKFVFRFEMQKLLPGLKKHHRWLAEVPVHSLQRVCRNLDLALKKSFNEDTGFPRFKARGKSRESFYVSNDTLRIDGSKVILPKIGVVRFRAGRLPEGKVMSATVAFDGDAWWCVVQCDVEIEKTELVVTPETVIGIDLGLQDLAVLSDGRRLAAPRHLRKAQKRLRRAQRRMARRARTSANRRKAVATVRRLQRTITSRREVHAHRFTATLVNQASAIITEDLNVKGMLKNRRLAMSFADAGWGQLLRQVAYKADWAGKTHLKVDRFEPTTQTCSSCGTIKTGEQKLPLSQRAYRCACGLEIDRDLNAAMNLRRIGLEMLCVSQPIILHTNDVGQALPERGALALPTPAEIPLPGRRRSAAGRYGSSKQESSSTNLG